MVLGYVQGNEKMGPVLYRDGFVDFWGTVGRGRSLGKVKRQRRTFVLFGHESLEYA